VVKTWREKRKKFHYLFSENQNKKIGGKFEFETKSEGKKK